MRMRNIACGAAAVLGMVLAGAGWAAGLDGLILALPFEEGKGDQVQDISAKGWKGKAVNATWVKGKVGGALEFNGTDSHVEVPGGVIKKLPNNALTLGAWFYLTGHDGFDGVVSGTGVVAPVAGQCCQYRILVSPGLHPYLDAGAHADYELANFTYDQKKWYHVTLSIGKEAVFYVDGKELDRRKPGADPLPGFETPILVGTGEAPGVHPLQGYVDEVFLFDRAIEAADIKVLMDGLSKALSVQPRGRLATAWAGLKIDRR